MTRFAILTALATVSGCFSSLVDGACADGYQWRDGECRLALDAGPDPLAPDADPGTGSPDADTGNPGVDAASCAPDQTACDGICTDTDTDPNACGACGIVCPSGICTDGACVGDVIGRVILIGHDYRDQNQSSVRLLGNAIDLPAGSPVRVGVWRGAANAVHAQAINQALIDAGIAANVAWERVNLTSLPIKPVAQVIVIMPQDDSAAAATADGAAWAVAAQKFIADGGVVIALGGHGTASEYVLAGAGLLDATPAGTATGDDLTITAPTDALTAAVLAPYRAEQSTASYHVGRGVVVVTSEAGDAVVIDAAGL